VILGGVQPPRTTTGYNPEAHVPETTPSVASSGRAVTLKPLYRVPLDEFGTFGRPEPGRLV
jgi:hypothetical protein